MRKICEHCKQTFECKAEDITSCFCNEMPKGKKKNIPSTYADCLCEKCLTKFIQKITPE